MDINYISPYIRVAMDSKINPPWELYERVIFDYELLYIKEGKALITIEDDKYEGKPGDIFLLKPKKRHSIKIIGSTEFRQPHIHFDLFYREDSQKVKVSFKPLELIDDEEMKYFREDITEKLGTGLPDKIHVRSISYFEDLFFKIINEYQAKMPFYEIGTKGLFLQLWTYLLSQNNYSNNPKVFTFINELERIKLYLDTNINKEVTLDELSDKFRISKFHLTRLFKKAFNITPICYHQMVRIDKAKQFVQYNDMSLTRISENFGFSSINAFSRAFRKVEGVPPSFYRR